MILVHHIIPIIVRVSKVKLLYDEPNERRVNKAGIPNLGGVALFIGITIATLLGIQKYTFPEFSYILITMIILFFVGIKDDIMMISPVEKLIAQIICALVLIVPGDIRLTNLHGILGIQEISYAMSFMISLLTIVLIINAINLIDGIDGLAAAIGILATSIFGVNFILIGNYQYTILCFAIIGSLFSFFIYNVFGRRNKIFMGDTGSLLIGLFISIFFIKYNEFCLTGNDQANNFSPIFSLTIISVPLFDMIRVVFVRILQKKSPFIADTNHIHHRLLNLGYSHLQSTLIIVGTNFIFIGIIYTLRILDNNILLILLGPTVIFFLLLPELYLSGIKKISVNSYFKIYRV